MGDSIMGQEWDASGNPIVSGQQWDANGNPIGQLASQPSAASLPPQEGLVHSFLSQYGIDPSAPKPSTKETAMRLLLGPAANVPDALKSVVSGVGRSAGEVNQAADAINHGSVAGMAQHLITALPIVGPMLDKGADQYGAHNYLGEVGTLLGGASQLAPLALGGVDAAAPTRPLIGRIPSSARAGVALSNIQTQMGNTPITLSQPTIDALEQAQKLSDAGHGTVTPLDSLYKRINQITPMDFEEARMRQSALSRLTGQDQMNASNWLKAQAKQVSGGVGSDLTNQVQQAIGQGDQFSRAMNEYRQAQQIKQAVKATAKVVGGAAGLGGVIRYIREASH